MNKFSCAQYAQSLNRILSEADWSSVEILADKLTSLIRTRNHLYICGNGGSAGNAMHLANDFLYGVSPKLGNALKVEALSANSSVITCLGNDLGYDSIFSRQIQVKSEPGDILIVLSGSGNSENIISAIETAKDKNVYTVGILGFDGGKAKDMLDLAIHFDIDDMQISEDLQLIVGHMLMKLLSGE